MPDSAGNAEQTRIVAEQVADTAIMRFAAQHPEVARPQAEIPPPLKWAAGIISGLLVMVIGGATMWLVSTVNDMQVTLARVDERTGNQATAQSTETEEIKRRLTVLEGHVAKGDRE